MTADADVARLFRRLSDQERFNIESRRSLWQEAEKYLARARAAEQEVARLTAELAAVREATAA